MGVGDGTCKARRQPFICRRAPFLVGNAMDMDEHVKSVVCSIKARKSLKVEDRRALREALENHVADVSENQDCVDILSTILALDCAGLIAE